jgi:hypothetical protein
VADWRPPGFVTEGPVKDRLLAALQGAGDVVEVPEHEFRELALSASYALPLPTSDGRGFVIRYAGLAGDAAQRVYVAERELYAGPRWSPERLLYAAVDAQVDQVSNVLQLTFERDWQALIGLLLLDFAIGGIYACVVGLILAVLGLEGLERRLKPKQLPPPPPLPSLPRGTFRA